MKKLLLAALITAALFPTPAAAQAVIVPSPVPACSNGDALLWDSATSKFICAAVAAASQPLSDAFGLIRNAANGTKVLKFDVSNISTATTRTWTIPDANITIPSTIASLGANTFTALQTLNGGLASTTGTFSSTLGVTGAATFSSSVSLAATQRLYFDGGGDTYVYEDTPNRIWFKAGGADTLWMNAATAEFGSTIDVRIAATKKLYLDGGGDTYLTESAANLLDVYAGGTFTFRWASTFAYSPNDFIVGAAKKLYLDGGGDTYIYEQSANRLTFVSGGTEAVNITAAGIGFGINPSYALHVVKDHTSNWITYVQNTSGSDPYGIQVYFSSISPNNSGNYFFKLDDASATRGQWRSNGGIANYSANNVNLSDRSTKRVTGVAETQRDKLARVKIHRAQYLDSRRKTDDLMWIADELAAIDPTWVEPFQAEEKDAEGNVIKPLLMGTRDNQIFMATTLTVIENTLIINELQKRVKLDELRFQALENQLAALRQQVAVMQVAAAPPVRIH